MRLPIGDLAGPILVTTGYLTLCYALGGMIRNRVMLSTGPAYTVLTCFGVSMVAAALDTL